MKWRLTESFQHSLACSHISLHGHSIKMSVEPIGKHRSVPVVHCLSPPSPLVNVPAVSPPTFCIASGHFTSWNIQTVTDEKRSMTGHSPAFRSELHPHNDHKWKNSGQVCKGNLAASNVHLFLKVQNLGPSSS